MIQSGLLLKLASKFAEEAEEAAKTLRSGELPAPGSDRYSDPHIEILEVEPFDHPSEKWVEECVNNLLLAKSNIEKAFGKVREFDPEVEMLFYNIDRYIDLAESAYKEAVTV
ncbi:MAG TPA: hypothetical protein VM577_20770 [Anaerovoracaceae bacterium]|nr:hypothetical protein [Anaerovoracaceae bacterium]